MDKVVAFLTAGDRLDEASAEGFVDRVEEGVLREIGQGLEDGEVETAGEDGGVGEQALGIGGEAGEAAGNDLADTFGNPEVFETVGQRSSLRGRRRSGPRRRGGGATPR